MNNETGNKIENFTPESTLFNEEQFLRSEHRPPGGVPAISGKTRADGISKNRLLTPGEKVIDAVHFFDNLIKELDQETERLVSALKTLQEGKRQKLAQAREHMVNAATVVSGFRFTDDRRTLFTEELYAKNTSLRAETNVLIETIEGEFSASDLVRRLRDKFPDCSGHLHRGSVSKIIKVWHEDARIEATGSGKYRRK
jgi:hypothetical protein